MRVFNCVWIVDNGEPLQTYRELRLVNVISKEL